MDYAVVIASPNFSEKSKKAVCLAQRKNFFFSKINDLASRMSWHASWIAVYVTGKRLGEYLGLRRRVFEGPTGHLLDQAGVSRITLLDPPAFGGPGET